MKLWCVEITGARFHIVREAVHGDLVVLTGFEVAIGRVLGVAELFALLKTIRPKADSGISLVDSHGRVVLLEGDAADGEMGHRRKFGHGKGAVVDEDAILNHSHWLERNKAGERVEDGGAILVAGECAMAEEDGASNGRWNGRHFVRAHAVPRGQFTARNAVICGPESGVGPISKPAVVNVVLLYVGLHGDELLHPIDGAVGQVLMGVGRTTKSLVGVGEVIGKSV